MIQNLVRCSAKTQERKCISFYSRVSDSGKVVISRAAEPTKAPSNRHRIDITSVTSARGSMSWAKSIARRGFAPGCYAPATFYHGSKKDTLRGSLFLRKTTSSLQNLSFPILQGPFLSIPDPRIESIFQFLSSTFHHRGVQRAQGT